MVDVGLALRAKGAACPTPGSLCLGITDPLGPWNAGTWLVTVGPEGQVTVEHNTRPADIEMTIDIFTRLVVGLWTISDALGYGLAEAQGGDPESRFARDLFLPRSSWHINFY